MTSNETGNPEVNDLLNQAFTENNYTLNNGSRISRINPNKWHIGSYVIEESDDLLKIYRRIKVNSLLKHPDPYSPYLFRLYKDVNDNYVALGYRGVVDSKNNIYLLYDGERFEYKNIYLKKLDSNLDVLIKKKNIVSIDQEDDFIKLSTIGKLLALVAIPIFFNAFLFIKKKKNNKN